MNKFRNPTLDFLLLIRTFTLSFDNRNFFNYDFLVRVRIYTTRVYVYNCRGRNDINPIKITTKYLIFLFSLVYQNIVLNYNITLEPKKFVYNYYY